jgi:predicted transcriptional regulator
MRRLLVPIIEPPKKKVSLSFRMEPELLEKLKRIAEREKVHLTHVLESFLKHAIRAYEKEKGIDLNKPAKD